MLELSRSMADRIQAEPSLELLAPVELSAICLGFRNGTDSRAVLTRLVTEGTALLGPVNINGRDGIRACICNYRTTRSDIDLVIHRILELALAIT